MTCKSDSTDSTDQQMCQKSDSTRRGATCIIKPGPLKLRYDILILNLDLLLVAPFTKKAEKSVYCTSRSLQY